MTFGSLYVERFDQERYENEIHKVKRIRRYWICKCNLCGKELSVRGENLISGNTKSCGCIKKQKLIESNKKFNKYVILDNIQYVTGYASNTGAEFIFDKDDYDLVNKHCWYETNYHYFMTRISKSKQIFLHRLILYKTYDCENMPIVDHINGHPYDCRKSNLRSCTLSENSKNIHTSSRNTSGFIGVNYSYEFHKWRAFVTDKGKYISLGYYNNYEDAVNARIAGCEKYYGDFSPV
jgi:hypothetical protein